MNADGSLGDLLNAVCVELLQGEPKGAVARAVDALSELGFRFESGEEVAAGSSNRIWVDAPSTRGTLTLPALFSNTAVSSLKHLLQLGTEAERAEGARERTEERLKLFSQAAFEGLFAHVDGVVVEANQRLEAMLGYSRAELLGMNILKTCVIPEHQPLVAQRLAARIQGDYVVTAVRKNGERFRVELNAKHGHLGERPVRVVAVRDVSERERAASLLEESERTLSDLVSLAFDLAVTTQAGRIVEVHGDAERLLGLKNDELLGQQGYDFVAPESRALGKQIREQLLTGRFELTFVAKNGEFVPAELVAANSLRNGELVRISGLRDLRELRRLETERRKLEQQLARSQRLESLGALAGGIAHDFNNLLVGILGNADLLAISCTDPASAELAHEILLAGQRASELVAQLLESTGRNDLRRQEPIDIGNLLTELRKLLDPTLGPLSAVLLSAAPDCLVLGNAGKLAQVFRNILSNASDALAGNPGQLSIRVTKTELFDARWDDALGSALKPGPHVLVEVEDTGVGMAQETVNRVFEPFFTTKSKGHGLGMAACLGTVSAHGGAVHIRSSIGQGTCFSVLLPAFELDAELLDAPVAAKGISGARVLIVDDEVSVRRQMRRSLELRGCRVTEAESGRQALESLTHFSPDLVVLDMLLGDMDGAQVLAEIRARGISMPVLLVSGYMHADVQTRLDEQSFQGFLRKPYAVAELLERVERALQGASVPS